MTVELSSEEVETGIRALLDAVRNNIRIMKDTNVEAERLEELFQEQFPNDRVLFTWLFTTHPVLKSIPALLLISTIPMQPERVLEALEYDIANEAQQGTKGEIQ